VERIGTSEVASHIGERVRIAGWRESLRTLGGISFLTVRDGSGRVQCVVKKEVELAGNESVLEVEGLVVAEAQAPGGVELHEIEVTMISPVREAPPVTLAKKNLRAELPALLEHGVLTARHPTRRAVFKLGSLAMSAFRRALDAKGFTEIQSPKLVGGATEGGANVFEVNYFGKPAFLAQSPQFYKQAMVGVFERVYEVGPVFRAEPHDTTRHLNEYVSLDVEMGFIENHFTVMKLLREVLAAMVEAIRERPELRLLGATLPVVPAEIPHLHFSETPECEEPDLSPAGERALGEWALREHGSEFLFVVGYPMRKRPFYTHPEVERPVYSASFDLLFRGTELVTGGQRLHLYEDYVHALRARGLAVESFAHYLEAFRFGMPPHGGFAIGLERFLMQLLGLSNIRLATLFPRDGSRLAP
jgi:nondiscriminating aspartyl-tRNA synthetase